MTYSYVDVDGRGHVTLSLRENRIKQLTDAFSAIPFAQWKDVNIRFSGTHEYTLRASSYATDAWVLQVSNEAQTPTHYIAVEWEDTVSFDEFEETIIIALSRFIKQNDQFGHSIVDIKIK